MNGQVSTYTCESALAVCMCDMLPLHCIIAPESDLLCLRPVVCQKCMETTPHKATTTTQECCTMPCIERDLHLLGYNTTQSSNYYTAVTTECCICRVLQDIYTCYTYVMSVQQHARYKLYSSKQPPTQTIASTGLQVSAAALQCPSKQHRMEKETSQCTC